MNMKEKTALHVLFVEDSEFDVELAVLELERDGFAVSWKRVELESDLRTMLKTNPPQVILSDYSMPRFDGLTALRVVQELAPDLPFIFMSGTIGEERAIESIKTGATDYVLKGNIRRLSMAVRRALSDVDERAQARQAEEARARLAAILEATSDYVAICDPQGTLIYMNAGGCLLSGLDSGSLSGTNMFSLHPDWARELIRREGWPSAVRKGVWHGETAILAADGAEIPVSQVIIAHRGPDNAIRYFSSIARDIRERKAYEARIAYLANYDALTELPNRSLLSDRVAQATAYRRRTDRSLALLVIDIDRFKLINDGYGQSAGDALLRMVGDRLRGVVREGDTVARLGADTFAVLAADLAHPDDVLGVVRKIQDSMRGPFKLDDRELHITVSIGGSVHPRDGGDFEALLRNADAAMHRVKLQGQNGFQFYATEMTRDAVDRVELEQALRSSLAQRELELHYQPQVLMDTGRIVGLEALMRWTHPQRGPVPPGVFIPIAEHSDLIFGLGDWALAEACRQVRTWGPKAATLRISVNVSARQFRNSGFPEMVGRVLRSTGLNPACLELELTESVLVEQQSEVVSILERLKALGVNISIDDFGTGYSSLSYLSRLPIDCLKIDQSFVQRCSTDRHDAAIVQAIISMARSLGMKVIAEGVETETQLAYLCAHGCQEGQGYLFSRPLPAKAAEVFLDARSH